MQINNGDLIIRDRGYCTIAEMLRILAHKADFIYRYYHVFKYYNVNTGKVIDVYKLVKNKKKLKAKVRIGSPDGVIVTLCADKVSDAIANERRRQLKSLVVAHLVMCYYNCSLGQSTLHLLMMMK